jgi:hypothetical protein
LADSRFSPGIPLLVQPGSIYSLFCCWWKIFRCSWVGRQQIKDAYKIINSTYPADCGIANLDAIFVGVE